MIYILSTMVGVFMMIFADYLGAKDRQEHRYNKHPHSLLLYLAGLILCAAAMCSGICAYGR